jgi:miniconductance mechanosensitive channel
MTTPATLLQSQPWIVSLLASAVLVGAALLAHDVARRLLVRLATRMFGAVAAPDDRDEIRLIARRLAGVVPALVVARGAELIPHIPAEALSVARNVCSAMVVLSLALAASAALNLANNIYQRRPEARSRPIKGYLQVLKLAIYAASLVLMAAALMERSPVLLLSGIGAMAAVLMLVFKDTLLALVASVQLTSNDMLRVGDWIEMPQLNTDGEVIDIALHTVKVQNWDKTIATIPTHRLITDSFRNWRGMQESGGRRIKRALNLDQASIAFLSDAQLARLRRFSLLAEHFERKRRELEAWNAEHRPALRDPVNSRRLTNVGTFRAYVEAYLRAHPRISKEMTLLVRQMPSSAQGLPLEIYAFTNTTAWGDYEAIQADIFDHLIAILPEFDLRLYQAPSGADLQPLLRSREAA